jgi:transposase
MRRNEPWRGVTVGKKNWTFAGSLVQMLASLCRRRLHLIETCKMNGVDPQACLADVLARLPDHPANKVADLFPWNWRSARQQNAASIPVVNLPSDIASSTTAPPQSNTLGYKNT